MDSAVIVRHAEDVEVKVPLRRLLTVSQVAERIPFGESWIRRGREFDPTFPDRIRVGKHRLLFYEDEIDAWLATLFEVGGKCPAVGGRKPKQVDAAEPVPVKTPRARL